MAVLGLVVDQAGSMISVISYQLPWFDPTKQAASNGKTTLHPYVGWMWDIGNTMWDDPTSFQFHFRFYIWNIKTKIVERQQLHRWSSIHLPHQPPYAWFWHIKISVPKSKSEIHFLQKSHIHPTFTEGNPVSINVILKVFTFLEIPHASHIMRNEHPTCIPHDMWYTPNRQTAKPPVSLGGHCTNNTILIHC